MLSSVGQVNTVQQFSALNAFKSNQNVQKNEEEQQAVSGTQTEGAKKLLDRIDINDVRKCAKYVGEFNISDDDIKYGLLYGRSVIAEYIC